MDNAYREALLQKLIIDSKKMLGGNKIFMGTQIMYLYDIYEHIMDLEPQIENYFAGISSNAVVEFKAKNALLSQNSRNNQFKFVPAYNGYVHYVNDEIKTDTIEGNAMEENEIVLFELYEKLFVLINAYETSMGFYFRHYWAFSKNNLISAYALLKRSMQN